MPTIPIGVTVPGWPENTWAVAVLTSPTSWSGEDVRVFLGAMSRCIPPRTEGECSYEITAAPGGVAVRVWRQGQGEARTYAPIEIAPLVLKELGLSEGRASGDLRLADHERTVCAALRLEPLRGS